MLNSDDVSSSIEPMNDEHMIRTDINAPALESCTADLSDFTPALFVVMAAHSKGNHMCSFRHCCEKGFKSHKFALLQKNMF